VEIGPIVDGQARVSVNNRFYDVTVENFAEVATGIPPAAVAEAPVIPVKPARSAGFAAEPGSGSVCWPVSDALSAPSPASFWK